MTTEYNNTYMLHLRRSMQIGPGNAISIFVSIVGMHEICKDLESHLQAFTTRVGCPVDSLHLLQIIRQMRDDLSTLRSFSSFSSKPNQRASLLRADRIIFSFTNAMRLLDDTYSLLHPLIQVDHTVSKDDQLDHWMARQQEISGLIARLEPQKEVIKIQATVLTWSVVPSILLNLPFSHLYVQRI